jgi:hypothetical protein
MKWAWVVIVWMVVARIGLSESITTMDGKTYENVQLVTNRCDVYGIYIKHRAGATKVLFTELPEDLKIRFGYDPVKISTAEKEKEQIRLREAERHQKELDALSEAKTAQEKERKKQEQRDMLSSYFLASAG